jgi:hypothetical protein
MLKLELDKGFETQCISTLAPVSSLRHPALEWQLRTIGSQSESIERMDFKESHEFKLHLVDLKKNKKLLPKRLGKEIRGCLT